MNALNNNDMFMLKDSKRDFAWGFSSARIISGGRKQRIVFYLTEQLDARENPVAMLGSLEQSCLFDC
jgi:hypothetical protein